jgi:aspartate ammonia-lyase
MRTALRAGDPAGVIAIATLIPADASTRSEPDFEWMLGSAYFLSHQFAAAERPLLDLFESPRSTNVQKGSAAYGLCGVYRKTNNIVEEIRFALFLRNFPDTVAGQDPNDSLSWTGRLEDALKGIFQLALGGTAVGTGMNAAPGFETAVAGEIASLTQLPIVSAPNKFAVQGAHDALVQLSGSLRTLSVSLYKIANDVRLMSCGPRAGFAELVIPANEPGSSIMPGKVNPTQAEALAMIAVQVMANDVAVGFGGSGGYLEMNVYKPLIIFNVMHSITLMADGCTNFRRYLVEGTKPNLKRIQEYVDRSLMLVTALSPVIGYDKASQIAHYALDNDLTLRDAALKLGFVTEDEFDRVVDPTKMVHPYVATAA